MLRKLSILLAILTSVVLVACYTPLPPKPADIEAKQFQPVPGKAVIYVVRGALDSDEAGPLMLDDVTSLTTLPGTYHRWVVEPGTHKIEGFGVSGNRVVLNTQPGQIYYLRHSVFGTMRTGPTMSALQPVGAAEGQQLVMRAQLFP